MIPFDILDPRATLDELGIIPMFLSPGDRRPAIEQIDAHYGHGGGWRHVERFEMGESYSLCYPGDEPLQPLFAGRLRDERIFVYHYGFVAVVQPDGSFEAARID